MMKNIFNRFDIRCLNQSLLLILLLLSFNALAVPQYSYVPAYLKGTETINGIEYSDFGISVVNLGNAAATVTPYFTNRSGQTTTGEPFSIGINSSVRLENAPDGFSAVRLKSNQPIRAINNIIADNSEMTASHVGFEKGANKLFVPLIMCGHYDINTWLAIQNASSLPNRIKVKYYDGTSQVAEEEFTLLRHSMRILDQAQGSGSVSCGNGLDEDFVGSAVITASQKATTVVNQVSPTTILSSEAFVGGASELSLPLININNYGVGTGIAVQNTSAQESFNVLLDVTCQDPAASFQKSAELGPSSSHNFIFLNSDQETCVGSATLTTDSNSPDAKIVALVNQLKDEQGSAYNGIDVEKATAGVAFPIIMDRHYGYSTAFQLQNVGSQSALVTCSFSNCSGNQNCVVAKNIQPDDSVTFYQKGAFEAGYVGAALCVSDNLNRSILGVANQLADNAVGDQLLTHNGLSYQPNIDQQCVSPGTSETIIFDDVIAGEQVILEISEGDLHQPTCFYANLSEPIGIDTAISEAVLIGPTQSLFNEPVCVTLPFDQERYEALINEDYVGESISIFIKDLADFGQGQHHSNGYRRLKTTLDVSNNTATACTLQLGVFQVIVSEKLRSSLAQIDKIENLDMQEICKPFKEYVQAPDNDWPENMGMKVLFNEASVFEFTRGTVKKQAGSDSVWGIWDQQFASFAFAGNGFNFSPSSLGGGVSSGVAWSSTTAVLDAWIGFFGSLAYGDNWDLDKFERLINPFTILLDAGVSIEPFISYTDDPEQGGHAHIPPDGTFGASFGIGASLGLDIPLDILDDVASTVPSISLSNWIPNNVVTQAFFNELDDGTAWLKSKEIGGVDYNYVSFRHSLDSSEPFEKSARRMAKTIVKSSGGLNPIADLISKKAVYVGAWRDTQCKDGAYRVGNQDIPPNLISSCQCELGHCDYYLQHYSKRPADTDDLCKSKFNLLPGRTRQPTWRESFCQVDKRGNLTAIITQGIGGDIIGDPATPEKCSEAQKGNTYGIICCLNEKKGKFKSETTKNATVEDIMKTMESYQ
ncbi:hypothetical protein [Aliikangiella coralliicola]|uniref:Uncharacterized protein n=1 Tax=Aliikangiella coralliicola TaxID=2592383 RepID=A0A545U6H6_9GAMM|nr:hypothetical protein [Aliikangiella coralliicola]TQV85072.1 hypothetical protein FLL46_22040 [Aliikangiella coralliicola]